MYFLGWKLIFWLKFYDCLLLVACWIINQHCARQWLGYLKQGWPLPSIPQGMHREQWSKFIIVIDWSYLYSVDSVQGTGLTVIFCEEGFCFLSLLYLSGLVNQVWLWFMPRPCVTKFVNVNCGSSVGCQHWNWNIFILTKFHHWLHPKLWFWQLLV